MPVPTSHTTPLYQTIAEIAVLWLAAEAGYRVLLPLLGFDLSYNVSPLVIAAYYAVWLLISIIAFWDLFRSLKFEHRLSIYLLTCLLAGCGAALFLFYLADHSVAGVPTPETDILYATPWYFLPKGIEILVQQVLIAALTLALAARFASLRDVAFGYALIFGGAHVVFYLLSGAASSYAFAMTIGSFLSAALFPYLILRVESGFVYAYIIHVLYYAAFVLIASLVR